MKELVENGIVVAIVGIVKFFTFGALNLNGVVDALRGMSARASRTVQGAMVPAGHCILSGLTCAWSAGNICSCDRIGARISRRCWPLA